MSHPSVMNPLSRTLVPAENIDMRLVLIGAFFLLHAAAPAYAAAPPGPTPVPLVASPSLSQDLLKIDDCSLEYNDVSGVPAKLHIDFENLNALPITHIRFRIETPRTTFAVMDVGSFGPKIRIHHNLDPPEVNLHVISAITGGGLNRLNCSVDAFTLTDGATWISPELQRDLQHAQPQQPHP